MTRYMYKYSANSLHSVLHQIQSEVWTVGDAFLIGKNLLSVLNSQYFSKQKWRSLKAVKTNSSNKAKTSHLLVLWNKLKEIRVMPAELSQFLRDTVQAKPCQLYRCCLIQYREIFSYCARFLKILSLVVHWVQDTGEIKNNSIYSTLITF